MQATNARQTNYSYANKNHKAFWVHQQEQQEQSQATKSTTDQDPSERKSQMEPPKAIKVQEPERPPKMELVQQYNLVRGKL